MPQGAVTTEERSQRYARTRQAGERTVPTIFVVDDENNVRNHLPAPRLVLGMHVELFASAREFLGMPTPRRSIASRPNTYGSVNHVEAFPSATAPPGACSNPLAARLSSPARPSCAHPLRGPSTSAATAQPSPRCCSVSNSPSRPKRPGNRGPAQLPRTPTPKGGRHSRPYGLQQDVLFCQQGPSAGGDLRLLTRVRGGFLVT